MNLLCESYYGPPDAPTMIFAAGLGHSAKRFCDDSCVLEMAATANVTCIVPESPGLTWDIRELDDALDLIVGIDTERTISSLILGGHSAGATFMSRLAPLVAAHPDLELGVDALWLYSGTWDGTAWRWFWPKAEVAPDVPTVVCSWDDGPRTREGKWAKKEMLKAGRAYANAGSDVTYLTGATSRHRWDPNINLRAMEALT